MDDDTPKVNGLALVNGGKAPDPFFVEPVVNALNGIGKSDAQIAQETMQRMIKELLGDRPVRPAKHWEVLVVMQNEAGCGARVWQTVDAMPDDQDAALPLKLFMSKIPAWASMSMVFDILSTVDGVTRIELTAPNGDGAVKVLD